LPFSASPHIFQSESCSIQYRSERRMTALSSTIRIVCVSGLLLPLAGC
jgi:hypothetical protein